MTRNHTDTACAHRTIFMRELAERVKPVKRFMISLYAICTLWTGASLLALVYSHEVAVFIVEHF